MTAGQLRELLDDYGDHLTVVIAWDEDTTEVFSVEGGHDENGQAAVVLVADR